MRAILLVSLLLIAGLAGCANKGDTAAATLANSTTSTALAPVVAKKPVAQLLNLSEDGNIGVMAGGCVFVPSTTCQFQEVQPGKSEFTMKSVGNLTALTVTMTWQSTSPATDSLTIGTMVMPDCTGTCPGNSTFFGETSGTSPLVVTALLPAGPIPMDATNMIHMYVYNTKGGVSGQQVPGFLYASSDQAFHVAAQATIMSQP